MKKILSTTDDSLLQNPQLGLCLSGGGALGFAHIGVLQLLEEYHIYPGHIAGSSMGAIIGTLYAAGYSPADMLQMIKEDKLYKATKLMTFRRGFPRSGLSTHSILRSLIRELIPHNSFDHLPRRMHICVSNLNEAEWKIVSKGNALDKWVAASASIPGVFEPIRYEHFYMVDGGLLNNFPAQALVGECSQIIGVDVIPHLIPSELKTTIDTIASSVRAMQHQNSIEGRKLCRYIIEPKAIEKFHEFSFDAFYAIYEHGYTAAKEMIAANKELLALAL